ncbi:MAG: CoA transferase, partial [Acetobacteraceae bacterium]|nr:CoA transferase [Acetobacteraceae bacterium]
SRVGVSAADIATGMYAQSAVLAALLRRERSGQGAHVSVAMLDALAEWMSYPMYRTAYADSPLPREALSHPALAPYGAHRAKDAQVIFGLQNEREWATFCAKVMGRPDWVSDPRYHDNSARREHREELKAEIEAFFADKTAREVVALLDAAGIANGRLNDARALWEHEQLAARGRWREIDSPAGRLRALLPPVTFADTEAVMGAVPALGQHTDAILAELGYAPGDIAALREAGAV